jgi:NAD(P)-dependent dehydrogenase (short-subunit alcohol dehydrogenase family)
MAIIAMTQAFAPLLREAGSSSTQGGKGGGGGAGRIVNVGSATGTMAAQCDGVYASSKHAVEGLTDSMRLELSAWDISVSLLVPGQVQSNMWGKLTGHNAPAEKELSPEQYALYKPLFEQVNEAVTGFLPRLSPPSVTSDAIVHALTNPYPKTRYLVAGLNGAPLWLIRGLCGLLPDRLVDFIKLNL